MRINIGDFQIVSTTLIYTDIIRYLINMEFTLIFWIHDYIIIYERTIFPLYALFMYMLDEIL